MQALLYLYKETLDVLKKSNMIGAFGQSWASLGTLVWSFFASIVEFYLKHSPKWAGGFAGAELIDICAVITGIPTNALVMAAPEMCKERFVSYVNGYTTILVVILTVLFVREMLPIVRGAIPYYLSLKKQYKNEAVKAERYKAAAAVGRVTKQSNLELLVLGQAVAQSLYVDTIDDSSKVRFIRGIVDGLAEPTKKKMGVKLLLDTAPVAEKTLAISN